MTDVLRGQHAATSLGPKADREKEKQRRHSSELGAKSREPSRKVGETGDKLLLYALLPADAAIPAPLSQRPPLSQNPLGRVVPYGFLNE